MTKETTEFLLKIISGFSIPVREESRVEFEKLLTAKKELEKELEKCQ